MDCQKIDTTPVEANHLNGFLPFTDSLSFKEVSPVGPVVEDVEDDTDKEFSVQSDIPTLVQVFKNVYDQRLASIENNVDLDRNKKNEEKIAILQQYLQHLQEQNDTFVSTMLELEGEAQQRVKQMEKRLKSSAKTTMEAVINVHECEKEMRRLVEERLYVESLYNDSQQHISALKEENSFLRDQNCNLSHDVQALLHIIHHARSTGHWEMNCVTFCEVTPEQVFGPVQSISNLYTSEPLQLDFETFESEKKTLGSDISSQEATDSNMSSPCTIHPVKDQLNDENLNHHSHRSGSNKELLERNKQISILESQLSELRHQLSMKDAECECHLWKLEMLMQQNRNRVQIFPTDLPSSGTSLPKCISLPDIGNIYSFTNVVRKSYSYNTFRITSPVKELPQIKNNNYIKPKCNDDLSEVQICNTTNKKPDPIPSIRTAQSEPHLFMFGDHIYVYRPCEPIKRASHIALNDDYEMSLMPCESIDLKFPTEESRTTVCTWTSANKNGSYDAARCSYLKHDSSSSCTCSDPEIDDLNREMFAQLFGQKVCSSVQTEEKVTYSIGLQAAIKRDGDSNSLSSCSDPGVNSIDRKILEELMKNDFSSVEMNKTALCSENLPVDISAIDIPKVIAVMQNLKESLTKAEDKAEAKEILISQLQGHLTSAVKEVELKDTALSNLEKKLDQSRIECTNLKQQIGDLNCEIHHILKDIEDMQMLNDNLCLKIDAKEERTQEILNEQKVLQEQKRALLTRLDAQEDELESTKKELENMRNKVESCSLQMEQQSKIIRNLQDALVQSKRAFDAVHQKAPLLHAMSSDSKNSSKNSIVDI
ncbi:uncharacterized protein TNIN_51301 [Trichonephila inaurata madagascariensis]|uniref:Uncharacterized protein n=1 Tax=Trichonephila inaurata madagascariensis TaxID=2747483 RepID=A0A8X6XMX2_9ARAC|nr:uncharacterized protein TNIN_51301 [Trichonephila inaurata madagascariensis]